MFLLHLVSLPGTVSDRKFRFVFLSCAMILLWSCTPDPLKPNIIDPDSQSLRITEIQSDNKATLMDCQGDYTDWFEIQNRTGSVLDLGGYTVSNNKSNKDRWVFPAVSIQLGGRLVVFASGKNLRDPLHELHTDFSLSASGDELYVCDTLGRIVDFVEFGPSARDQSWNRRDDGVAELTGCPSPGGENLSGGLAVEFSLPAGVYSGRNWPQGLQVSLSGSDVIRYTTDGSNPDENSPLWDGTPIVIPVPAPQAENPGSIAELKGSLPGGMVISACTWTRGKAGAITRNTYIVHNGDLDDDYRLAIVSLSGNPVDFSEARIFDPNNLYSNTEYPVHVEYFDESRELALEQDAGIGLFGAYSRTNAQKSFALYARSSYGKGRFDYDFFGARNALGGPINSFENLVLRNSGNDWESTMLRDALMTSLLEGTGQDYQAYKPVAVYLNGVYWGFYSLREKVNENFIYSHHPATKNKALDLIANFWEVLSGSGNSFNGLMNWLESADLSQQDQYDALAAQVDVNNFMDYQLANIFFGNTDWPGNNSKWWKPQKDGLWRWIVFDTDFGFGLYENVYYNTLAFALDPAGPEWPNPERSTRLLRKLMANSGFSTRFYQRLEELLDTNFSTDRVLAKIAEYRAQAEDEILHRHLRRWSEYMMTWLDPLNMTNRMNQWGWNMDVMTDFATRRPDLLRYFAADQQNPPVPARGTGDGLKGTYYSNFDWQGDPVATQTDALLDFTCPGDTTPIAGWNNDSWSAIWSGWLESSFDGPVFFSMSGDDTAVLQLDINQDGDFDDADETIVRMDWAGQRTSGYATLSRGVKYPIRVQFRDWGGDGALKLGWAKGSVKETIPQSQFYTVN